MITLQEVKKEKQDLIWKYQNSKPDGVLDKQWKKEKNQARKRIHFLGLMITYLESNPTSAFVKQQLVDVDNKINILMSRFTFDEMENVTASTIAKIRKKYEKDNGVSKCREQKKVLKYLLKK